MRVYILLDDPPPAYNNVAIVIDNTAWLRKADASRELKRLKEVDAYNHQYVNIVSLKVK